MSKGRLGIELGFEPDPDRGVGADPDDSVSWGWFQFWVGDANLCRHVAGSEVVDRVHWYLLPVLEWLVRYWNRYLHEQRLPGKLQNEGSARVSYLATNIFEIDGEEAGKIHAWREAHALRACAGGGIFPDIFFRRHLNDVEISWGHADVAGVPEGLRFLTPAGTALVPPIEVANALYEKTGWAIRELRKKSSSARIARLAEAHERLRDPQQEKSRWLAGLTEIPRWATSYFQPLGGLVIEAAPLPVAMFGSLSPTVGQQDFERLMEVIKDAEATAAAFPAFRFEPASYKPWDQGYEFAEHSRAKLGVPQNAVPVPIEDIVKRCGVRQRRVELEDPEIRAVALCGESLQPTIAINFNCPRNQSEPGLRFTLAHELCHILYDQDRGVPLAVASGPWAPRDIEQRANAFASMFLMPREQLRELFDRHAPDGALSTADLKAISKAFKTSRKATLEHLHNLGLLSRDKADELDEQLTDGAPERDPVY